MRCGSLRYQGAAAWPGASETQLPWCPSDTRVCTAPTASDAATDAATDTATDAATDAATGAATGAVSDAASDPATDAATGSWATADSAKYLQRC